MAIGNFKTWFSEINRRKRDRQKLLGTLEMQKDGSSVSIYLEFKNGSSIQVGYYLGLSFKKIVAKTFS